MVAQPPPAPITISTARPSGPMSPSIQRSASPTERSFFGAISSITSRARSRSRSRVRRDRSRSPMPTPMASPSTEEARPAPARHTSTSSSYSSFSTESTLVNYPTGSGPKRRSTESSDFERMAYGRHSTDWLFNGLSVTKIAKETFSKKTCNER